MKIKKLPKPISIVLMAFISLFTPSCTEDFDVLYGLEDFGKNIKPLEFSITTGDISYKSADILLTLSHVPVSGNYTMGICYDLEHNPGITNNAKSINVTNTSVITNIYNLQPITKYYARVFYDKGGDIVYSNEISFSTTNGTPVINFDTITNITANNADVTYIISSQGASNVKERGICWSTSPSPSIIDSKTIDGTGFGTFNTTISNLNSDTTYYVRAYATNDNGTQYSNEKTFITRN